MLGSSGIISGARGKPMNVLALLVLALALAVLVLVLMLDV
jgi:hypothetical protein